MLRFIVLLIALFALVNSTLSQPTPTATARNPLPGPTPPAITLQDLKSDHPLTSDEAKIISGSCGESNIQITGVAHIDDYKFAIDFSKNNRIVVRSSKNNALVLESRSYPLSDYNGVACISTKNGLKLLIWSKCGGSKCSDSYDFYVIDTESALLIAPKLNSAKPCNAECASRILGNNIPRKIDE